YGRTIELDGHRGVVFVQDVPRKSHVAVDLSTSLAPALMPLLARLRRLLDLDAEPATIDAHLAAGGLAAHVAARPGLRAPGAVDGFEVALRAILRGRARDVVEALGEPLATRHPALRRLTPDAHRVASAGAVRLTALGVPNGRATALVGVARLLAAVLAQPRGCTSPEYRQFDFFVGDWNTYDVGAPNALVARNRVTRMVGGCALREVYEQRDGLRGESFSTYDASRKRWHQSWVTNRGQLLLLDGGLEGDRMVL